MNPLAGIGMGLNAIGLISNLFAQNKLVNQAQTAERQLTSLNNQTLEELQGLDIPALDLVIDRSRYKNVTDAARMEAVAAQGRAGGEEFRLDQVRQSAADAYGRAVNTAGSGADLLGAISDIQVSESQAVNQVSADSADQRLAAIRSAKDRFLQAANNEAAFNFQADQLEFQNELQNQLREFDFEKSLIAMENEFGKEQISQAGAVAQAKAARLAGVGGSLGSVGTGFLDLNTEQNQLEIIKAMYS